MARRAAAVDPAQASLFDASDDGVAMAAASAITASDVATAPALPDASGIDEPGPHVATDAGDDRPGVGLSTPRTSSPAAPMHPVAVPLSSAPAPVATFAEPTATLQSVLPPSAFVHPHAERRIALGGHVVGYALRRAKRRSIGFIVGAEGLSVNAPKWVGVREIEAALQAKSAWIIRKLAEQQERARRLDEKRIDWRDGAGFPFLGETVIVVLDPRAGHLPGATALNTDASALPGVPRLTLHVALAHTATPAQIRDAVQSWLQRQAKRIFEERCDVFAPRLGVRVKRLALSSAQTRWGSASANGDIRLHWRLVHFAMPTIDYVVAHELAHLREMNHSERFWDVVRSVVPDYEQVRRTLKSDALPALD